MLVLSRKRNESIVIDGNITVTVLSIEVDRVRLGFTAPPEVPIHRQEVFEAIHAGAPDRTAALKAEVEAKQGVPHA